MTEYIKCSRVLKSDESKKAKHLTFSECVSRRLLRSPDSFKELIFSKDQKHITDGRFNYSIRNGSPILYPNEITREWVDGVLPQKNHKSSLLQYVLLSQIKQQGEINAPMDSKPAQLHRYRFQKHCIGLRGRVLDVGCDTPSFSIRLFPEQCEYIGIDPYSGCGEFRIIGLGEILPIASNSMDAAIFNTTLDHMLDYITALEEAVRVLKVGGKVVVASYAWLSQATLLTDSVHFHHFREYQIIGALEGLGLTIEKFSRYEDPKNSKHRFGLYVTASKSE
jgi:ubiquinone/menaquinone biosynthesis C-methylase UbiE